MNDAATSGEYVTKNFKFGSQQILEELRQGYLTLGEPTLDARGRVTNAVLLLHNTTGTGADWLSPEMADHLFGPGQPLDASRYYIVMPDCIGFGRSSKPSDGLRARFPNYRYADQVRAQQLLLSEHLKIDHLRLVLGLSMGGMLTWLWGTMYPDAMDALVPIACQPTAMSGRNWLQRRMSIEAIRNDPGWNGGDYVTQPSYYSLLPIGAIFVQSVARIQDAAPTREATDAYYRNMVEKARKGDANDRLYQVESSMDYDPYPMLDQVRATVLTINFEDDELNPPELGSVAKGLAHVANARSVLLPTTADSKGHYSTQQAQRWSGPLVEFLRQMSFADGVSTKASA
ncbi:MULTISPECIES: alpha/beta fold hydrolase [unclassified Beijerinckia]|uniref:alpha/beta fold hydrolase n=1 Tax=unclassified Beijerinckia TaxID=2638183 RepID=UPI00089AD980|nr:MULTISPECIES: alpha/beta fold hydrolase [unclassified Beijerinckia]MDH7796024.1 homoserine O-acetyltransferase [Beijerinckia sp. GAS462]SEC26925.1 homoserine O-acetyltransferase [Beijerinckia sp. 28-YEA-48]